jgi:protein SCO1/2
LNPRRFLAALALLVAACSGGAPHFEGSDVTGASFGHDFSLPDTAGHVRTLADYRGKAVALFFGYTQCPDVCPTTMAALAEAMKKLGADAARVQVLFVTVDPDRDTPQVLAAYAPAFDPRFVALRGDAAATERTAREFRIIYQKVAGPTPDRYTMDHSAGIYLFDPEGRLRVFEANGASPDVLAHDLGELLKDRG